MNMRPLVLFLFLLLFIVFVGVGGYLLWQYTQNNPTGFPPLFSEPTTTTINSNVTLGPHRPTVDTFSIASWNLQRLGPSKGANQALMESYASKMKAYDIIVVQEVTDESGYAWNKLCYLMQGYTCKLSARRGNTSYQEQYGVLFDQKVTLRNIYDSSKLDGFQRPPYALLFTTTGNWTFLLTTIHTTPEAVHPELSKLEIWLVDTYHGSKLVIGDLNADCQYYPNIVDFSMWQWPISDGDDTTVAPTNCAYDRLLVNPDSSDHYVSSGIMTDVTPEQSDHYLIYGVFKTT